jgi:hypothetical protein
MLAIDIPALPEHADLAAQARALFASNRDGTPQYPNVRTAYFFVAPDERVNIYRVGLLVSVPWREIFVQVTDEAIEAVVAEGARVHELPWQDLSGLICAIGVLVV